MGSFSIWHWLVVGLVIILLFGKGRISDVMGDLAKGIKSFKKGLSDEEAQDQPLQIDRQGEPDARSAVREGEQERSRS